MLLPLLLVAALAASGCRDKAASKGQRSAPLPCREFGQTCEYSPGKLGSCVQRDDCSGPDCFVCQSQH